MRLHTKAIFIIIMLFLITISASFSIGFSLINEYNHTSLNYPPGIEWVKTLSIDDSYGFMSMDQTSDDGYIIAGSTSTNQIQFYIYLIKTDENGNEEWNITYAEEDFVFSVQQTSDEGYIVGGLDEELNPLLLKTDEQGNKQWIKSFQRTWGDYKICFVYGFAQETLGGGYFLAGNFGPTIDAIKTSENGSVEWIKTFPSDLTIFYGKQVSNGDFILTGTTDFPGCGDTWIVRLDENGDEIWNKTIIIENYKEGSSGGWYIDQTSDNGYILESIYQSEPWWGRMGDYYKKVLKLDSLGNFVWENSSICLPRETDDRDLYHFIDLTF